MGEEIFRNLIRTLDLETRVAILRKRAEQEKVMLPEDVALYIAQNVRSNASALEGALVRLLAHSSLIGTDITLNYTKQVLGNFIDLQARKATVDPFQKMSLGQRGTEEANITRQAPTALHPRFRFLARRSNSRSYASRRASCSRSRSRMFTSNSCLTRLIFLPSRVFSRQKTKERSAAWEKAQPIKLYLIADEITHNSDQ